MVGMVSYGVYIPYYRITRSLIADAWDFPEVPGEKAVANNDEDSITMAVEAGLDCIRDVDGKEIDELLFASTSPPYKEKQNASVIAAALDLREDVKTVDFTGSLKACTSAIRSACNAIKSGESGSILVTASDCRVAPPESMEEYQYGDGAAAVLIGKDHSIAEIVDMYSISDEFIGPWRKDEDEFVRHFESKHETKVGYAKNVKRSVTGLFESSGMDASDFWKAAIYSPDPRRHMQVALGLGFEKEQIQDHLFMSLGDTGNSLPLIMLAGVLEEAEGGEDVLLASYGEGSDAIHLKTTENVCGPKERKSLEKNLKSKKILPNYDHFLRMKDSKIKKEKPSRKSSPVTYWRDRKFLLNFYGIRCNKCDAIQYPIQRVCINCGEKDNFEEVKLEKKGEIFTYTLDHLSAGEYYEVPIPRAVVELEDGCRVFLEVVDCDPEEVEIGMPIELTFRKMHEGGGFKNYYWKCRLRRFEDGS